MLKKSLPIGLIATIFLISLAVMGVAYGAWTDSLLVQGTVATGNVAVEFEDDPYPSVSPMPCAIGLTNVDKLYYIFGPAYPGFTCSGTFTIKNTSTVPVRLAFVQTMDADVLNLNDNVVINCPAVIQPGTSPVCTISFTLPNDAPSGAAGTVQTTINFTVEPWSL